jgi:hypothetical protein
MPEPVPVCARRSVPCGPPRCVDPGGGGGVKDRVPGSPDAFLDPEDSLVFWVEESLAAWSG